MSSSLLYVLTARGQIPCVKKCRNKCGRFFEGSKGKGMRRCINLYIKIVEKQSFLGYTYKEEMDIRI